MNHILKVMKLLVFTLLLPPIFVIVSCSTTAKKDSIAKENEIWLQSYIRAKAASSEVAIDVTGSAPASPRQTSCELFTKLSQETKFTLRVLALIRAHMVCENTDSLAPAPVDIAKELGPEMLYLKSLNDQRSLIEAERSQNSGALSSAWRTKALASDRVREKVQFLQKALEYAQKNKAAGLPSTTSIEEIQNRIYALAPRLQPEHKPSDYQKVGNDYFYNREFPKAREFFQKIIQSKKSSFDEKYAARKSYRNTYKVERNRDSHIAESEKLTRWLLRSNAPGSLIHESYITWARSLWTIGKASEAKAVLQKAEKSLKRFYPLDEVAFIRGRMDEERGDFKGALAHYEKGEAIIGRTKGYSRDRIIFSKGWALRKLGRFEEAATTFEKLRSQTQDPFDGYRYQFWQARSLKESNATEKATLLFQDLRSEDTLGFYGLMAHRELGEELPPLNAARVPAAIADKSHSGLDAEIANMIQSLTLVDEKEVLEKYLSFKTQDLKNSGSKDPDVWLAYLKAYAKADLFLPLFTQLGSLDSDLKVQLLKENPDLLFPRKYVEIIQPWAEKLQVNPELVLSIIRQESAFNPFSRSPADAFGLMQVLPSVAYNQEKTTGVKITHHEDLYVPEKNIPVGMALLSELGKKYRGQFILIAAAYNASEKAIEGWLRTRLKEDPLEFIEDIPYDETRAYVKLVLRNFIFYSRLNQPQNAMPFPEWCLEDLQSFKLSTARATVSE
jgi:soluble lytic murein transglycosylase